MVTPRALRIAFFGTPDFAVPTLQALLDSRHSVVAVVCQPDRPRGRGQHLVAPPTRQFAERRGVPVWQPTRLKDDAFLDSLRALEPHLGVVAAYGRILPDVLLALPPLGLINVHASLLPAYRGAAPIHRAVIAGDAETGVSIMRVVQELDAGPVFATGRHAIGPDETSVEVERHLATLGASLLLDVVEQISRGGAVEVAQDYARATHAPKITKEEGRIAWTQPAPRIHNLVRGLQPWPLVSIWIGGVRHRLLRTSVSNDRTTQPGGTIVHATAGRLSIAAGDGGVVDVVQIQPDGRRAMATRDYLAGREVPVGALVAAP